MKLAYLFLAVMLPLWSACSLVNHVALETTAEILSEASPELETEHNWQRFRLSVPSVLKTMEALWYSSPENTNLLSSLTKGYGAYGYGVYETLAISEILQDKESQPYKSQAIDYYGRAINYGLRFLKINGITVASLRDALKDGKGLDLLEEKLDKDSQIDVEGAFFLGFSWFAYINLQRDQTALVSQIYIAKGVIDWACRAQPQFRDGLCKVLAAAYETSRPKMLGGNPAKGAKLFTKAIKEHPNNLMIPIAYIQYSLIPAMNHKGYMKEKQRLISKLAKSNGPMIPGAVSLSRRPTNNQLFNSIAKRRFHIISRFEKEIFE